MKVQIDPFMLTSTIDHPTRWGWPAAAEAALGSRPLLSRRSRCGKRGGVAFRRYLRGGDRRWMITGGRGSEEEDGKREDGGGQEEKGGERRGGYSSSQQVSGHP